MIRIPDYNGGFVTKQVEGSFVVTRDNKGYLLSSEPVNFIKKSLECKYGTIIDYSENIVVLQKGSKTVRIDREELNNYLVSQFEAPENPQPEKRFVTGTFETEAGKVLVKGLDENLRSVVSDPDLISIGNKTLCLRKSIGNKTFFADTELIDKKLFVKNIDVEEKLTRLFIKGLNATLNPAKISTGDAWNKKGGQKPGHKYIERKPHPSGEGYIYLYKLPNGTAEWRDDNGKSIDVTDKGDSKEYNLEEFKTGDNVRMGDKLGRVEDTSTNLLAVNFSGKVQIINKKDHIEKLKEHQLYKPGQVIKTKEGEAKILQMTDNLALIKDIDNNKLSVINLEKHITKLKKEDSNGLRSKLNKFNYVNEGYAASEYEHNFNKTDYANSKEYVQYQENATKAGFGDGDLKRKKYVKTGNNIHTVEWRFDPHSKETIVYADGVRNLPIEFAGKRYSVTDIDSEGYTLNGDGESGLRLSHKDYQQYWDDYKDEQKRNNVVTSDAYGETISNPKQTYHFHYNEEPKPEKQGGQGYRVRWKKREEKLQTPEEKAQIEAERQQKLIGIKEALGSDAYKQFESTARDRGFEIGENRFNAQKIIEVEGNKFVVQSEFDPEAGISNKVNGKYSDLELGDNIYPITDITKDRVFYNEQGTEKSISIDELKQVNGKKVFEPTKESKGLISSNPATKFYFSPDEGDAVSGFYEVIELKDLIASHKAGGEANPLYSIGDAQNRDRSKMQSKAQISRIATNPNFDFLGDNKTVQDGAPVVNEDYEVIAGNGRGIGIGEHYAQGGDQYRNDLIKNAKRLGFNADDVSGMNQPVLVRRVNVDNQEAQRLGAKSNESNMLKTEAREEAKGKATRIDDKTFNSIADTFKNAKGDYASLSDYLEDIGPELVKKLSEKGIISDNEKHLYYDLDSGKLNASHKEKLKDLLTQSILGDSSQHFENIPDAARQGITKGLGELFSIKGQESDLVPHLQNAVKILAKYNTVKDKFSGPDDFIAQDANNMLDPLKGDKKDLAMFEALTGTSPNEIKNKFRDYVNKLEGDMFEPPMNADEAFKEVFKPKYEAGINKSLFSRLKAFGRKLFKSQQIDMFTGQTDEHGNQLLPSKKNPNVRRYQKNNQLEMEGLGAPKMKGADDYLKHKGKDEKETPLFNQEEKDKNQLELKEDAEKKYFNEASIKEYGTKGIQIKTSDGQTLWIKGELYLDKAGGIDGKQKEILIKRELKNAYNNLLTKKENDEYNKAQGVNNTADLPGIGEIEKLIFTNNINKINEALKKLNEFVDNATDKHLIQVKKLDIEKLEYRKKELQPFENYDEANDWIEKKEKEYGSKNKFLASDEYKKAYPKIKALRDIERSKYRDKAKQALEAAGQSAGDEVEYSQADAWHNVTSFTGKIVMKDGIPYVNLNEKTVNGKKQIKWHKGFRKVENKQYDIKDRNKVQADILQDAGIPEEDIPNYVLDSVADGKILGKRVEAVIDGELKYDEAVNSVKKDYEKMKSGEKDTKFLEQEENKKTPQTESDAFKSWFKDSKVVDESGKPLVVYHGTPVQDDFESFSTKGIGLHLGTKEQANGLLENEYNNEGRVFPLYAVIKNPIRLPDLGDGWDRPNMMINAIAVSLGSESAKEIGSLNRDEIHNKVVKDWDRLYDKVAKTIKADNEYENLSSKRNGEVSKRLLQEYGYDGIVYANQFEGVFNKGDKIDPSENKTSGDSYIVFNSEQIKSAIGNDGNFDPKNKSITKGLKIFRKSLSEAVKVESEHEDLYNEISKRLKDENIGMPMSKKEFFTWIAKQHIDEKANYYDLLKKYVEKN